MIVNSSGDSRFVVFLRNAHICGGREVIAGTRLERRFIRYLREECGLFYVEDNYPWLTEEQILAC